MKNTIKIILLFVAFLTMGTSFASAGIVNVQVSISEPASMILLGIGLFSIGTLLRERKNDFEVNKVIY